MSLLINKHISQLKQNVTDGQADPFCRCLKDYKYMVACHQAIKPNQDPHQFIYH